MVKVYWASRHNLSPDQLQAIREIHGDDVIIIKDPRLFVGLNGLADYMRERNDGFVYAVANPIHFIAAAAKLWLGGFDLEFGIFEHYTYKYDEYPRVINVWHVSKDGIKKVWSNPREDILDTTSLEEEVVGRRIQ